MGGLSKRIALVLGNAAYEHAPLLKNPRNDAEKIAAALTRIGFSGIRREGEDFTADLDTPSVSAVTDLSYESLQRALATFGHVAESAQQAVLYYAGHGIEIGGENFLVPVDAKLFNDKGIDFEAVSLMRVLRTVEGADSLRLIILDACRDNPFRDRLSKTRQISRGLSKIEPSGNILVAYAAKHGTVALDGNNGNSPYAAALLAHMEIAGLEVIDLFRKVRDAVKTNTGKRQEPYLYGTLGEKPEYLVPPTQPPLSATNPPMGDERAIEYMHWMEIQQSVDPRTFERFLLQFPNGQFAPMAISRETRLIAHCREPIFLERLLADFPPGPRTDAARQRLAKLRWANLRKSEDLLALEDFADEFALFPESEYARLRIAALTRSSRLFAVRNAVLFVLVATLSGVGVSLGSDALGRLPSRGPTNTFPGPNGNGDATGIDTTIFKRPQLEKPKETPPDERGPSLAGKRTSSDSQGQKSVLPPAARTSELPTASVEGPCRVLEPKDQISGFFLHFAPERTITDAQDLCADIMGGYATSLDSSRFLIEPSKGRFRVILGPMEVRDKAEQICDDLNTILQEPCYTLDRNKFRS